MKNYKNWAKQILKKVGVSGSMELIRELNKLINERVKS